MAVHYTETVTRRRRVFKGKMREEFHVMFAYTPEEKLKPFGLKFKSHEEAREFFSTKMHEWFPGVRFKVRRVWINCV